MSWRSRRIGSLAGLRRPGNLPRLVRRVPDLGTRLAINRFAGGTLAPLGRFPGQGARPAPHGSFADASAPVATTPNRGLLAVRPPAARNLGRGADSCTVRS